MSTATEFQIYPFTLSPQSVSQFANSGAVPSDTKSGVIIKEPLDDTFAASLRMIPDTEDVLARMYLISMDTDRRTDIASLTPRAFLNLVTIIWNSLQILVVKHGKKPTSLRLKFEPVSGQGLTASMFHSDSSLESPTKDPRPAPFHGIHSGHMATDLWGGR